MDRPQRVARKAERITARKHGGQVTPASGSGAGTKNDVRTNQWSFEVKSTSKASYSLRFDDLVTAEKNALVDGRDFGFIVEYSRRPPINTRRYVVLAEEDYIAMVRRGQS